MVTVSDILIRHAEGEYSKKHGQDYLEIDINNMLEGITQSSTESYDKGFSDGREEGYTEGWDDGFEQCDEG